MVPAKNDMEAKKILVPAKIEDSCSKKYTGSCRGGEVMVTPAVQLLRVGARTSTAALRDNRERESSVREREKRESRARRGTHLRRGPISGRDEKASGSSPAWDRARQREASATTAITGDSGHRL